MEPFVDCCSPEEPCYGCVMLWHRQQDEKAGRQTDDPVEIVRQAAQERLDAEGSPQFERVPF